MNQVFIFIGGYRNPGGVECDAMEDGDGYKMNTQMRTIALSRPFGKFLGVEGTIESLQTVSNGWNLVNRFLTNNVTPDGKVIIYGYSAGGNNALEFCRRIEMANNTRSQSGQALVKVDLLITVDPAGRDDQAVKPNGQVAGCVVKNVNYYQTQTLWGFAHAHSVKTSTMGVGKAGTLPNVNNTDLTDSLTGVSSTKHQQIEGYTLQTAIDLINSV